MIKILNLKLVIMSEFLNTKMLLLKDAHQTSLKNLLLLVKLKLQFYVSNGKVIIVYLIVGLIKMIQYNIIV